MLTRLWASPAKTPVLVCLFTLLSSAAHGATLLVDDLPQLDCPGAPYTSIQAAITAASPGDTRPLPNPG
jgi:hypothetical protein